MVTLSYSSIYMLYNSSHQWVNKMMSIKQEDRYYFREGREAGRIIEDHVAGIKKHPDLAHITEHFSVVEQKDFDPQTKFEFSPAKGYIMCGWADGLDREAKKVLEVKSSGVTTDKKTGEMKCNYWTITKFKNSMQRKVYSIGFPWSKEAFIITAPRLPEQWKMFPPKLMSLPQTKQDGVEAMEWILGGIKILEAGDFTGGLIDGECRDPYCNYGTNCYFKKL